VDSDLLEMSRAFIDGPSVPTGSAGAGLGAGQSETVIVAESTSISRHHAS